MKVACAIVERDEKVLVQNRIRQGKFVTEFPMGKIDCDESPEKAAERELREETSLVGSSYKTIKKINEDGDEVFFVFIDVSTEQQPIADSVRKQTYFWFEWKEIPTVDFHKCDREFIKDMINNNH
ncbi:MAG: NUDIX hydrolase [Oligoflexia bacterium]|nr:NUDIX hydrolase [Oligoflexia bacterium]